ncbi:MAG: hypothetical protein AAGK66_02790 [Pseudomonadota bacterium]
MKTLDTSKEAEQGPDAVHSPTAQAIWNTGFCAWLGCVLGFVLLLVFSTAAHADEAAFDLDHGLYADAWMTSCNGSFAQGTVTKIGDAEVTSLHNLGVCNDESGARFPDDDLVILKLGDPGTCQNAVAGEGVWVIGHPELEIEVYTTGGWGFLALQEISRGTVTIPSAPQRWHWLDGRTTRRNVGKASTDRTRRGYSGGPLISVLDGRIVGMHRSGHDGAIEGEARPSYFLPVEEICAHLRAELAKRETALEDAS